MTNKITNKIKNNVIIRNIVLAISLIVLLAVFANLALKVTTRHGQKNKVPNFSGMTINEANSVAKELRLRLEVIDSLYVPSQGRGVILEQYPKPGNFVKSKRRVFLTTNTFQPKMVPLPYVSGFSLRQAKNKLTGGGFVIEKLDYVDDIATNNVLGQIYGGRNVTANSNIMGEFGSGVTLKVGVNPVDPEPLVPNLIGLGVNEAKNRIWESGFNVGSIETDSGINYENIDEAHIYSQYPAKTTRTMYGKSISLKLSLDSNKVTSGMKEADKAAAEYQKQQSTSDTSEVNKEDMEEFFNTL